MTPLDQAFARMMAEPETDAFRLRYYEVLAQNPLYLLLDGASGDTIQPTEIEISGTPYVLAFDSEARLADFATGPADMAAMTGAELAAMVAGSAYGIGLNLGVAASEYLLPSDAVAWLAGMLEGGGNFHDWKPESLHRPIHLDGEFATALAERIATLPGLATEAWLSEAREGDAEPTYLFAIAGAARADQPRIRQAVLDVVRFSGVSDITLDIGFFELDDPLIIPMKSLGLPFPFPPAPEIPQPAAPGMQPGKPPKLH